VFCGVIRMVSRAAAIPPVVGNKRRDTQRTAYTYGYDTFAVTAAVSGVVAAWAVSVSAGGLHVAHQRNFTSTVYLRMPTDSAIILSILSKRCRRRGGGATVPLETLLMHQPGAASASLQLKSSSPR
jgi:hypothetical protein